MRWALDAASESGLSPVLLVVGYRGDDVRAAIAPDDRVMVIENRGWAEGIASSLRAALATLIPRDDVEAVCVGLADQPLVGPAAYRLLAADTASDLTAARYDGEPGNPVKLARSLWSQAMELRGDAGARVLMRDRVVTWIDCTGTGSAADIDTLEDLERLQQEGQ